VYVKGLIATFEAIRSCVDASHRFHYVFGMVIGAARQLARIGERRDVGEDLLRDSGAG
jgi:hypothetical protein